MKNSQIFVYLIALLLVFPAGAVYAQKQDNSRKQVQQQTKHQSPAGGKQRLQNQSTAGDAQKKSQVRNRYQYEKYQNEGQDKSYVTGQGQSEGQNQGKGSGKGSGQGEGKSRGGKGGSPSA